MCLAPILVPSFFALEVEDSILGYVERRLVAVYPLYATTLLPAFAINKALGVPMESVILAAQTFLLQAWNPEWTEGALGGHCWFLSAMVLHFILFKPLTWVMDKLELRGTLVSLLHFAEKVWNLMTGYFGYFLLERPQKRGIS